MRRSQRPPYTCWQVYRVLQHYLDDGLEPEPRRGASAHLLTYESCLREVDAYRTIGIDLAAVAVWTAPVDAVDRLRQHAADLSGEL